MTAAAEGGYNYYIDGDGFFMLKDQITGEISYTRAGNFSLSVKGDEINLINDNRKQVLDENKNPIQLKDGKLSAKPGIFSFQNTEDMQAAGFSEYTPIAKNGQPQLAEGVRPVSYTHLDVYKRQDHGCADGGICGDRQNTKIRQGYSGSQ